MTGVQTCALPICHVISDFESSTLSGAVEIPAPPAGTDSLEDAVAAAENYGDQMQDLLSKVKHGLQRFYLKVCPLNKQKDVSLNQLVRYVSAEKDPLISYEWDQRREGVDYAWKLALAHGVDGKALISATADLPKDSKGSLISLSSFDSITKTLSAKAVKL